MQRSTVRRRPASKVRGPILMIVGVAAIIWGVYSIGTTTASCGGQTMHAGDTCVETTNGIRDGAPLSISQKLANEHKDGWGGIAGGVLLLLVGGIVVMSQIRRRAVPGSSRSQAPLPAGGPPAGGEAAVQQPYGLPSRPEYAQPGNLGYGQQQQAWGQPQEQGWAQPQQQTWGQPQQQGWGQPQYPRQGQYPQR